MKINNGYEIKGGAEDGREIPYKVSDLAITSDSPLTTEKSIERTSNIKIKRQHTQMSNILI